ncbi:TIGR03032 family protein [Candidatus Marithrix sp. Canyon 246]|uniref:TIGR03032 family protein n=1 Tax=Candidatus Marithrix sp. Canyon 246 TaxID=1827136 RepID=UPI00084A00C0|nr:TIGR03032 family protein [Candidatus Marithrix sp. Canyon 246]
MTPSKNLDITGSRHLIDWFQNQQISLALTTYQSSRLFLLGVKPDGSLSGFERLFDRAMGLYATPERLYMSSRYQLWQFDNVLAAGELDKGYDKLYVPRIAHTTGDLDIHDLVVDKNQNIIFVNTLYNCLATLSERHSFKPLWQPPFISKLVAEDRCHLNGLALVDGEARYVTAVSQSDVIDGWRERRHDGGCVIDIKTNEIITKGLSMPHSPRWYQGKLWLLNSGEGEFGYIENGKFQPLTFCPGYMRGLAFSGDFAIVALSKAREKTFTGLALDEKLAAKQVEARCGLMIIDLKTGEIAHWLRIEGIVTEFYDVQVLAGVQRPKALGFKTDEIQRLITIENDNHKQNALVSIIIPCYKQAHFLAEAVESVVSQSYPDWEIIIVNDGSPDNTNEVAQQLINKHSNKKIRLLKKPNGGLADARNAGIAIANGEYIHPLDADDKLAANALRNLVALAMEQTSPCVVFGSYQRFGVVNTRFISLDHYSLKNLLKFNMVHANSMFSKKVWQMLKGYKTEMTMYEDWEFWIHCHKYNIPFIGTRNIVLYYRKHYDSITANNSAKKHNFFLAKIIYLHPQLFDPETIREAKLLINNQHD